MLHMGLIYRRRLIAVRMACGCFFAKGSRPHTWGHDVCDFDGGMVFFGACEIREAALRGRNAASWMKRYFLRDHIMPMPPMPGLGIAGAGFSSFLSAMTHSVVRNMPAIEAAFSRATRVTLAGSMTPAAKRSSY